MIKMAVIYIIRKKNPLLFYILLISWIVSLFCCQSLFNVVCHYAVFHCFCYNLLMNGICKFAVIPINGKEWKEIT